MKVLVTGGAGFIGTSVVRRLLEDGDEVVNLDKLTYAGSNPPLGELANPYNYCLEVADVADWDAVGRIFAQHQPDAVMHLAAESHVDRSIDSPDDFIQTNIIGTYTMLEVSRAYWKQLDGEAKERFRFHHISTDEVYGSLGAEGKFTETTPYQPSSPYSASKASSDHLVRAWWKTYGFPTVVTNCSNNYGPWQFPEKLIPLMILNALAGKPLPVYGNGANVRDWLYVTDHAAALVEVLRRGRLGETYNIGGGAERSNLDIVRGICRVMDEADPGNAPHEDLITFVQDRPGHDLRYAIDDSKLRDELGWRPEETLDSGLRKTVVWYLENSEWWQPIHNGVYKGERLGGVTGEAK